MDAAPWSVWVWRCFKAPATSTQRRFAEPPMNSASPWKSWTPSGAEHVTDKLDALVLPGGESTTMRIASRSASLLAPCLAGWTPTPNGLCSARAQVPSFSPARRWAVRPYIAAGIARNAWGRQRESFEAVVRLNSGRPTSAFKQAEPAPSAIAFLISPLEVASSGADGVEEGFPASSSVHLGLNKGPWPARRSHAWATRLWVCLTATNSVTFHPELRRLIDVSTDGRWRKLAASREWMLDAQFTDGHRSPSG